MKDRLHVLNTKRLAEQNPAMRSWLRGGDPKRIEAQEKQGQRMLVRSDTLPTDIKGDNAKEVLETAGMKFLGPVDGDDMFQYVELPQGWKKVPTDHPMWLKLIDNKGRERASIFYKAAFYDRSAHMSLTQV